MPSPIHIIKEISRKILEEMSEDSEEEDYSDRSISDDDELDEDSFMKFDHGPTDSIGDPFFPRTTQILLEYQLGRWVPRLREPRDLYGVSSSGPLSPTRWPYHCEVIDEKVQHIDWTPFVPEPVYVPTGLEIEPVYPNSKEDTVVYLAEDAYKEPCFVYSRVGGNRTPLKQPVDSCDDTLVFEARFESGNLQKYYEYELTVRPDLFTNKHTQWYYFQVTNTQAEIVYRFTIVNFTKPASLYNRGMRPLDSKRKAVILTARVHPGETNSSWIMKGFLDYILGDSSDARLLRDTFIFKVVPMLNPDGVIVGNYRCSLAGRDLNRNYTSLLKESFPSVWYTRNMINRLMEKREVILYCDLHGHSRKQNIFMYGCDGSSRSKTKGLYLQQRIFPLMLSKNCPNILYHTTIVPEMMNIGKPQTMRASPVVEPQTYGFCQGTCESGWGDLSVKDIGTIRLHRSTCKFNVQKSKEGTGRVVMWKMGIRNSFTLEATFCGSTLGNKRGTHFSTKDLESIGFHFCDSLLDYCDPDRSKYYQCLKELEEMEKHMNLERALDDSDTSLVEISLDVESSSRGSDSSESNDTQTYLLKVTSQARNKKKYLKTKRERNAILANHQNNTLEVYGKAHLLQRHEESNSDGKDAPDVYVAHCFRRSLPNQGLVKIPGQRFYPRKTRSSSRRIIKSLSKDHRTYILETCKNPIQEVQSRGINIYESCFKVASLKCPLNKRPSNWMEKTRIPTESHHQLKNKAKRCMSFQSKRTGTNWTDDEKRIYRDKRIAQTQEILQYLLPIVESSQSMKSTQMTDLVNPRADFQQHQPTPDTSGSCGSAGTVNFFNSMSIIYIRRLIPTACISRRRYSTPWTPTRNLPFKTQRHLMTDTSEWLQSVPQGSFESLSPLCNLQKTKHFELWTKRDKDVQLATSKWKTVPSSSKMDANIIRGNSLLQPKGSTMRDSEQRTPYLSSSSKNCSEGVPLTFQLKLHRNS
ncbi:Cytosolic carboxypeptidase 3 [Apodemus speciosus]|uniref:Cytosolic carboxypeptidase 3 n=1 Tax=Apodemus speciosus TaxID=105296 RepID=A0ABQ0EV37_APOSI